MERLSIYLVLIPASSSFCNGTLMSGNTDDYSLKVINFI